MFSVILDATCVTSQISGCNCRISQLQQETMGLPVLGKDASLRLVLKCSSNRGAIRGHEDLFSHSSTLSRNVFLRNGEEVDKFAAICAKFLPDWQELAVGGNYLGEVDPAHFEEMIEEVKFDHN